MTSYAEPNPKTSIAPMLSVRNGAKAVDFYISAFGASQLYRVEDPSGAVVVWPVNNQHGWRIGRVVDPFGHHWEIGKNKKKSL